MNHITQLTNDKAELTAKLVKAQKMVTDMMVTLSGEKYQGFDPADGERKDWVGTRDMNAFLLQLRSELL